AHIVTLATSAKNQSPIRLLRRRDVLKATGLSNSALYREIALGEFPRPVKISHRCSAWVETEIDHWIANRILERDGGAAS
ncbi:unnamed protein product, partial [Ectocarpus sp. 12 AP-2014]